MRPRTLWLAVILVTLSVSGCARWHGSQFDPRTWRDPRASDIDGRLSGPGPSYAESRGSE